MTDHVILEGDPDTDSTRRHLERVLKNNTPQRTLGVALAAGGTAWGVWRLLQALRGRRRRTDAASAQGRPAERPGRRN